MKTAFKSGMAAAAFIAVNMAGAATITVPAGANYKSVSLSGSQSWAVSPNGLKFLTVLSSQVTPSGVGAVSQTRNTRGAFSSLNVSGPLQSVALDSTTDALQASTQSGGVSIETLPDDLSSAGGSLVLTDLQVDLLNKRVYAKVNGGNGVGDAGVVYLWDFDAATTAASGATPVTPTSTTDVTVSGMHLTTAGADLITTALGLTPDVGVPALKGVTDFGTVAVHVQASAAILTPPPCLMTYRSTRISANAFTVEATVRNSTSNLASGWTMGWDYKSPALLSKVKNAKITSKNLKNFTAQSLAANKDIGPGAVTAFSFRGQTLSGQPLVSGLTATLGGLSCTYSTQ
jgi:hypothetical protein